MRCNCGPADTRQARSVYPAGWIWAIRSWLCLSVPSVHQPQIAVIGWPALGGRTCTSLRKYTSFLKEINKVIWAFKTPAVNLHLLKRLSTEDVCVCVCFQSALL